VVILYDCFDRLPIENYCVAAALPPYWRRWLAPYDYIEARPEIRYAWLVDSTDVRMVHNPFPAMTPDTFYCGWGADNRRRRVGA
jgi:hypothetical protein